MNNAVSAKVLRGEECPRHTEPEPFGIALTCHSIGSTTNSSPRAVRSGN